MKPETIIKRVKEQFLLTEQFDYIIMEEHVVFPLKGIKVFSSRSIARCHFHYWAFTPDFLFVRYNKL